MIYFRQEWYAKRHIFRWEWYTHGWILGGSGIPKDGFGMGVVYNRMNFRREWYSKGWILDVIGIQKGRF